MNKIKRALIMPFLIACLLASLHSLFGIITSQTDQLAWIGSFIAVAPMFGFMIYLGKGGVSHTSRYMPIQLISAVIGSLIVLTHFAWLPAVYAWGLGLIGVSGYVFWYSNLNRPDAPLLAAGQPLPNFELHDSKGNTVSKSSLMGNPSIMLFYRGNWCPLCVAQVQELVDQYQELAERGVETLLISPQSQQETEKLAKRFQVPFRFIVDKDGKFAKQLNIFHPDVTPPGLGVNSADSVYPTVVISDKNGIIIWSDLTDNYRVRPEPELYLQILNEHGVMPASLAAS